MTLWNLCADQQKGKDSHVARGIYYQEVRGGGVQSREKCLSTFLPTPGSLGTDFRGAWKLQISKQK